jgi:nucleoside-diphosphate kinase
MEAGAETKPMETTFVVIKPDAFKANHADNIVKDLEALGLEIVEMWAQRPTLHLAKEHYIEHKGKNFYEGLCSFLCEGDVVAVILYGESAVSTVRNALGNVAQPEKNIEPKGLRGKYGTGVRANAIHASDSVESAKREISLWRRNIIQPEYFDSDKAVFENS